MILYAEKNSNSIGKPCPYGIKFSSKEIDDGHKRISKVLDMVVPIACLYCILFCRHAVENKSVLDKYVKCMYKESLLGISEGCIWDTHTKSNCLVAEIH